MITADMDAFPEELTTLEGWEDYISEFDESEYEPLWGYIDETICLRNISIDDLPDADAFRDVYRGEWDSFTEYATEYIDQCDFFGHYSEFISSYFDYEKFANDLIDGYYAHDASSGKVYVYEA